MIKSVIWASMLDYPEHICSTLFFGGCNFNCEYCYNKTIINLNTIDFKKEILPKLLKRKELVSHIVLSGGECTIANDFQEILDTLYYNGFIIGIHTNGSRPDVISRNINKIAYIGMDIKNDFHNYTKTCNVYINIDKIKESVNIIKSSNINYEFRTTIYPKEINIDNCINIAKFLKRNGIMQYVLQNYNEVEKKQGKYLSEDELLNITTSCNKIIHTIIKNV